MASPLCPSVAFWRIACIDPSDKQIRLHLEPVRSEVSCPVCGTLSSRVHRRYRRHAGDLPWSSWPVQLSIEVRHFFCDNPECQRRIFTEPFPEVLARYARRTGRSQVALLELAHASSAERAALVARLLGFIVSPDTLIRWQLREQFSFASPLVLGVDEFALRRGHSYATILVDLLRHLPIDVLDEKSVNSLTAWLREHPGITALARDRDDSYALAGRSAAPDAVQVADRFHLLHNVSEALKQLLFSGSWATPTDGEGSQSLPQTPDCKQDKAVRPEAAEPTPLEAKPEAPEPTSRKRARWEVVQEAHRRGLSLRAIARETRLSRVTVRKYLQQQSPPDSKRRQSPPGSKRRQRAQPKLAPYLEHLRRRWAEGCQNVSQLYRELVELGYSGGRSQLYQALQPWRSVPGPPLVTPAAPPPRSLLLSPAERLNEANRERLKRFLDANPPLFTGYQLKERFLDMVRKRRVDGLDAWLQEAERSGLPTFQSVAKGMRRDYQPVRSALTLPWSTGQCEGQNCRVKLIKRMGYGRARPELLRQRVLHRPAASS